ATLEVTNGSGTKNEVVVPGVVTKPSYDPETRKITLPVAGEEEDVVIELGKDIFIDKNAANGYNEETQTIDIYLNDGDGTEDKPSTKVSIPAAALVDVYTGKESATATVAVSDDNKIEVGIKLSKKEGNALSVDTDTEGGTGLYLSLENYYNKTEIDTKLKAVNDDATALTEQVNKNKEDIATLNGDATTEGSVAKAVADAKKEISETSDALEGRVKALEDAFGFGTF
ncbi:MAG: hypothetical protein NC310_09325, partial [Roseburia sp.]|nr:hypothetical protein [Roseburia sp.]